MADQLTINRAKITNKGLEAKHTTDGRPMVKFTVMWSSSRKNQNTGAWENGPTKFVRVLAFDDLAKMAYHNHAAGSVVSVAGRVEHFTWSSDKGEQDDWTLIADFIAPFTSRQQEQTQQQPTQQQAQQNIQDAFGGQEADPFGSNADAEPPF